MEQKHINKLNYLKPPSLEMVEETLKKSGVSAAQFERFHGMYIGCITNLRIGFREIPARHWHLFYESTNNQSNHLRKEKILNPNNLPNKRVVSRKKKPKQQTVNNPRLLELMNKN